MVIRSSPLLSIVQMFSFSKNTSTPDSFRRRIAVRLSTVFRANLDTDFVTMRSILPESASSIIRLKPSRRAVLVPVMPSSVYIPASAQPS